VEDAQADLEADQNKLMQQLGQKILAVIERTLAITATPWWWT
jgi:hypothetical protein